METVDAIQRAARTIQRNTGLQYSRALDWVRQHAEEIRRISEEQKHKFEVVALEVWRDD